MDQAKGRGPVGKPDRTDVALLAAIRDDGRITVQDLSAKVGLASATASVRLQTLRNQGFISGIHARVNYPLLGYSLCAYVLLTVSDLMDERLEFTNGILALPEVEELAWITGEHDVIVKIWAKDTKHLEAVVVSIDGLGARSKTLLALGEPLNKSGIGFEAPPTTITRPDR